MKIYQILKAVTVASVIAFALTGPVFLRAASAATLARTQMVLEYDGAVHAYDSPEITLMINEERMPADGLAMPPIIVDDRTYVPVRAVFEKMGALVDWKELTSEVFIGYNDSLMILRIGDRNLYVDGEIIPTEVAPKIINNRTMIPVKFASEALGFTVDWDPEAKIVSLTEQRAVIPEEPYFPEDYASPDAQVNDTYDAPDNGAVAADMNTDFNLGEELAKDVSRADISDADYPLATISDILLPTGTGEYAFTIRADSEISKVKKMLLKDNRLVIDFYNATIGQVKSEYALTGNPYISKVRTGQNQVTPAMVARVVFDLSTSVNYSVGISDDRKAVTVQFEKNFIHNVTFSSDGIADYIRIEGETRPATSILTLTNPNRLVIDIPLGVINETTVPENGVFTTALRIAQFEGATARIVADVRQLPSYEVTAEGTVTTVKLIQPTYRNIAYDPAIPAILIPKAAGIPISLDSITQTDRYVENKYVLNLNADYSEVFGYGEYRISDGVLKSVGIQTHNGNTELCINQNRILAYDLYEDANYIYIKPVSPKEKYAKIVIIDPGHGGQFTGTIGNGLQEKDLNLAISQKVIHLLEQDGRVKVYATRLSDVHLHTDLSTELLMRSAIANTTGDLFISIHNNSFSATSNGTETYYDKGNNRQTSGVSQQLADILQRNLLVALGSFDRKVQTSDFSVLRHTNIPAVLTEIGFVSNPEEAAKLATDEYQMKAAKAIFDAVIELFETYRPAR